MMGRRIIHGKVPAAIGVRGLCPILNRANDQGGINEQAKPNNTKTSFAGDQPAHGAVKHSMIILADEH
jgi:hypothetical protein